MNAKTNIKVLGPDINKSDNNFVVGDKGEIFGLEQLKDRDAAVSYIIEERNSNGDFKDIYDFICRTSSRAVGKKHMNH